MRKAFICSLCHNGIHGGGLYLDKGSVTYVCQKLTVDEKYKNLELPLREIMELTWKWVVFPVATFRTRNGEAYRLIIFNKARFMEHYREYGGILEPAEPA